MQIKTEIYQEGYRPETVIGYSNYIIEVCLFLACHSIGECHCMIFCVLNDQTSLLPFTRNCQQTFLIFLSDNVCYKELNGAFLWSLTHSIYLGCSWYMNFKLVCCCTNTFVRACCWQNGFIINKLINFVRYLVTMIQDEK